MYTKEQAYKEIEEKFGFVPTFFKNVPADTIGLEWELYKKVEFEDGPIPPKYRELMGLALSAATKCHYCTLFHSEMARLNGATDEELESAVNYAKNSTGWSTYINGMGIDYKEFEAEVRRAVDYAQKKMKKAA